MEKVDCDEIELFFVLFRVEFSEGIVDFKLLFRVEFSRDIVDYMLLFVAKF